MDKVFDFNVVVVVVVVDYILTSDSTYTRELTKMTKIQHQLKKSNCSPSSKKRRIHLWSWLTERGILPTDFP